MCTPPRRSTHTVDYLGSGENGPAKDFSLNTFFLCSLSLCQFVFVQGDSYPEFCAQRTAEGDGFHVVGCEGRTLAFLCFISESYISLWDESVAARINK